MTSGRERKLAFIAEAGFTDLRKSVLLMLSERGASWLTDDQIDDLYRAEAAAWERAQRRNAENRERVAG
jgi:hypothetical protein